MKFKIEGEKYDTCIETSDWRYSASIVGLIKYLDYLKSMGYDVDYNIDHDRLEYNSEDILEERYLQFVEYYFSESMHHRVVEQLLDTDDLSDEQIKLIKDKLKNNEGKSNSIMKKTFKDIDLYSIDNQKILQKINDNRPLLIKETYRNGRKLYSNFANEGNLLTSQEKQCRLVGYYVDKGKKSKSISYNWDFNTYSFEDEIEFDFIPFAFSKSREAFFINNNYSIKQLVNTNSLIEESDNPRSTLFKDLKDSANFIDFDVEVIVKNRDNDYFETLHIRKDSIEIFKKIDNYNAIQFNYKVNDNYYISFEKEVTDKILNKVRLDNLIELLLKAESNYNYRIRTLIKINSFIYGGDNMDKKMYSAFLSAKDVVKKVPENKVNSYKQKLISAMTLRNYNKFNEILLQLASYSGVVFDFAYDLFQDFESNKNVAYAFVNALNKEKVEIIEDGGDK